MVDVREREKVSTSFIPYQRVRWFFDFTAGPGIKQRLPQTLKGCARGETQEGVRTRDRAIGGTGFGMGVDVRPTTSASSKDA